MTAKVVRATFDDDIGVVMASSAAFSHTITTVIRRNSEVCLATTAGVLERSPWVARGKQIFDATSAIVLADLSFSAGEARIKAGVHVIHMDHSAELGLLALALSDGTAFVLPDGSKPTCRWVAGVSPRDVAGDGPAARVVALNSRFRLLAVGLKDGDTAVYSISDTKSGEPVPVLSHTLDGRGSRGCGPRTVGSADAPGAGPVASLDWTDDGYAIAVAWARGGFAVWSVFGSPLSDTAADNVLSSHLPFLLPFLLPFFDTDHQRRRTSQGRCACLQEPPAILTLSPPSTPWFCMSRHCLVAILTIRSCRQYVALNGARVVTTFSWYQVVVQLLQPR